MLLAKSFSLRNFLRPAAAGAALLLGLSAFGSLPVSALSDDREIGMDEFAAPLYRALKNGYDLDGDGQLTVGELRAITSLDLSDSGLSSLEGIEYLTGLTYLDLSDNNLTQALRQAQSRERFIELLARAEAERFAD